MEPLNLPTPNFPSPPIQKTLRSEIQSKGKVIGVRHKTIVHDQSINERAKKLLEDRDSLTQEQREKNDALTMLKKELQIIQAYEGQFVGTLNRELKAVKDLRSKWDSGLSTFRNDKLNVNEQITTLQFDLEELQRKISVIDRQLQVLQVQPTQQSLEATVLASCTGTNTVQSTLHYVVPSASWTPESDLFVETRNDSGKLKLQISAQIRQATGEDWSNANITLSTAQPNLGAYALYPAPIRVNGAPNQEQKVMVQSTEDRSSLTNAGYVGNSATNVTIDDNGQSMQLSLPHRTTILSNGQSHWVPIDVIHAEGALQNVSIPRATPYVFETVTFSNPAPYSLLGGSMHLYKDGSFIGDHQHKTTAPGEKMEISMGVLSHIRVERKTLMDKRDTKLLGKSQQLTRAYAISIQNNSDVAEKIEIREAIPLSKNEDIQVTLSEEETTGEYSFDEYKGFVTWSMSLEGGKQEGVELLYNISVPSDWQVN